MEEPQPPSPPQKTLPDAEYPPDVHPRDSLLNQSGNELLAAYKNWRQKYGLTCVECLHALHLLCRLEIQTLGAAERAGTKT